MNDLPLIVLAELGAPGRDSLQDDVTDVVEIEWGPFLLRWRDHG